MFLPHFFISEKKIKVGSLISDFVSLCLLGHYLSIYLDMYQINLLQKIFSLAVTDDITLVYIITAKWHAYFLPYTSCTKTACTSNLQTYLASTH